MAFINNRNVVGAIVEPCGIVFSLQVIFTEMNQADINVQILMYFELELESSYER